MYIFNDTTGNDNGLSNGGLAAGRRPRWHCGGVMLSSGKRRLCSSHICRACALDQPMMCSEQSLQADCV
eukprot:895236-Pleurochrysis_carterae.AAC.1